MIRILRAPVAASVQDSGRYGHRAGGHARSGAMDPLSLSLANRAAGAPAGAAAIELGPGPVVLELAAAGIIAFAGSSRDGAPWWQPIEALEGARFELSAPRDGTWSYVAVPGGIDAPLVLGSRATCVREGIGRWLVAGDVLGARPQEARAPEQVEPPPMRGPIRLYGDLPGRWRVGTRIDRMGYQLTGGDARGGAAEDWSEPLLPGFVQIPPSGEPFVLMTEGPTVGGYEVAAAVHSEDLRLVAQSRPGDPLGFVPA